MHTTTDFCPCQSGSRTFFQESLETRSHVCCMRLNGPICPSMKRFHTHGATTRLDHLGDQHGRNPNSLPRSPARLVGRHRIDGRIHHTRDGLLSEPRLHRRVPLVGVHAVVRHPERGELASHAVSRVQLLNDRSPGCHLRPAGDDTERRRRLASRSPLRQDRRGRLPRLCRGCVPQLQEHECPPLRPRRRGTIVGSSVGSADALPEPVHIRTGSAVETGRGIGAKVGNWQAAEYSVLARFRNSRYRVMSRLSSATL